VTTQGWRLLNLGSLLPMALTAAALSWMGWRVATRREAPL